MKVKSFGCSFIFGNELPDDGHALKQATASRLTWPALTAQRLGADYQCFARPGAGNLRILEQIMQQAAVNEADTLFLIGWTWIERFDYIQDGVCDNQWQEPWRVICPITRSEQAEFYYRHFHTELKDKLQSLIYMRTAVDLLRNKRIPFVMTAIDDLVWDRTWHVPVSVTDTQDHVRPCITDFEGQNFLAWSRSRDYPMGQHQHPLEQAHQAAAETMWPVIEQCLINR